jgi:hypothetical protein
MYRTDGFDGNRRTGSDFSFRFYAEQKSSMKSSFRLHCSDLLPTVSGFKKAQSNQRSDLFRLRVRSPPYTPCQSEGRLAKGRPSPGPLVEHV